MIRFLLVLAIGLCSFCELRAEARPTRRPKVVVDNQVLAFVRDQTITVVDVMKKLDMVFYQQYPQYRGIVEARYEFYAANWRKALDELVDRRLAMILAEEKQFRLTNGDIREELEELYGPNVLKNLYEEGMQFHDAAEMTREDITFRRILNYFVQLPIYTAITPSVLKEAYERKIEALKGQKGWVWRSVTIKPKVGGCSKEMAEAIQKDLQNRSIRLRDLMAKPPEGLEVTVSQEFRSLQQDVAPPIAAILETLTVGSFSQPVAAQKNESNGVWRLYIVDEHFSPKIPELFEIEEALKNEIAAPELLKKTEEFFQDLRRQYHAKYVFSEEQLVAFQPFALKQKEADVNAALSAN